MEFSQKNIIRKNYKSKFLKNKFCYVFNLQEFITTLFLIKFVINFQLIESSNQIYYLLYHIMFV